MKRKPWSVLLGVALTLAATRSALGQDDAGRTEARPAPAPAAAPAAAAPADGETTSFLRLDTDSSGTQLVAGGTHSLGPLDVSSCITVSGASAELDAGAIFTIGKLDIASTIGVVFDFEAAEVTSLVAPQLYFFLDTDWLYFESWNQIFWSSLFLEGAQDLFYTRNFVLFEALDALAVGGYVELTYGLNEDPEEFESGVLSLPVGAAARVSYGEGSALLLFLGYETEPAEDVGSLAGRFTFIHEW